MVRTSILSILLLMFFISQPYASGNVSPEMADFLKHRNVLLTVDFTFGSNELTEDSRASIDRIASDLQSLLTDNKIVRIEGHASPVGKEDYNLVLSMRRAMAVQEYLQVKYGLELDLYFNGYGSERNHDEKLVQLAFYDDTLGLALADIDSVVTQ